MMKRVLSFLAIALTLFVVNTGAHAVETVTTPAPSLDPENTLYMDLPFGRVVIALRPDKAPKTVARIACGQPGTGIDHWRRRDRSVCCLDTDQREAC